jgi:hypothetical protein
MHKDESVVLLKHYLILQYQIQLLLSKDNNIIYHIIYMIKYYPYKSDKPNKKNYIITNNNKNVYFGASGYSDFTMHKDESVVLLKHYLILQYQIQFF